MAPRTVNVGSRAVAPKPCGSRVRSRLAVPLLVLAACGGTQARPPDVGLAPREAPTTAAVAARPFVSPYSYANYVRAEVLAVRGEHAGAIAAYQAALAESDDDTWVQARLALALHASGQREEALELLDEGLSLRPGDAGLWLARGQILLAAGRHDQAIGALERADAFSPRSADAAIALARALHSQGQPRRAIAVLQRRATDNPAAGLSAARARLELALAQGDADNIEQAVSELFQRGPVRTRELQRFARQLEREGRTYLASELMERATLTDETARLKIRLLLQTAAYEQAAVVLAEAPPAWLGGALPAAKAWLAAGEPARALELARTAESTAGGDPDAAKLVIGEALLALDDAPAAALVVSQIPSDSPRHDQARVLAARALMLWDMPGLAREVTASDTSPVDR